MFEFLQHLFDTEGFPARWHCGTWTSGHGWLHVVSDVAVFLAYTAIPLVLAYFVRKRGDLPFGPIFWLFCGFIFACGTTHLIEASIFWHPWYRFSGVLKLTTAVVSWATVIALVRVLPSALALPGLDVVNARLSDANVRLERSRARLRNKIEELDAFASIASHDLREPARHVRMLSEAVLEDHGEQLSDDAREMIAMLGDSAARMDALVRALAHYTRAERAQPDWQSTDTGAVVAGALDDLAERVRETDARVDLQPLPQAWSDPVLLRQVVQNLLANALNYHRAGEPPKITVAGHESGPDTVVIVISDRGQGIPPERIEEAFQPFRRLHAHDEIDGSGIGLPLCRRLVTRLGGDIAIESEVGVGTTVRVTLPSAEEGRRSASYMAV